MEEEISKRLRPCEERKPVAWLFKFNNGVVHVETNQAEADAIRRNLELDETETPLYPC